MLPIIIINKMASNQVGSFSICTISYDQLDNYTPAPISKVKKPKQTKVVVHEIFDRCAQITDDKFWQLKLSNAANNKFPRGFSYVNNQLSYKKGSKTQTITVSANPEDALSEIIDFFHTHASMFSPQDVKNNSQVTLSIPEKEELTWSNANKKMQELLLAHYVEKLQGQYNLSSVEMMQALSLLTMGVNEKYFHKDNIVMKNRNIVKIEGLWWDGNNRKFSILPDVRPLVSSSKSKKVVHDEADNLPNFRKMWFTYLKVLQPKTNFDITTLSSRDNATDLSTDN